MKMKEIQSVFSKEFLANHGFQHSEHLGSGKCPIACISAFQKIKLIP